MRIMDKLVCIYCKKELENMIWLGQFYVSICIECFMQYLEKFQHLQKWNDEKTDPRHHDYGLEIG